MNLSAPLNILYFGIYSKGIEYPRNNNLIRALRLTGAKIIEAHVNLADSFNKRIHIIQSPLQALLFSLNLAFSFLILTWKFIRTPQVDIIIVGHPGYFHIHLAKLLRRLFKKNALLVYDVFIPLYDTIVEDRKLVKPDGIYAQFLERFEASSCRCADICLIDTNTHRRYLSEKYGLPSKRLLRVLVGPTIGTNFDSPPIHYRKTFNVVYVGTYIPLHGVEVILDAAKILNGKQNIHFFLVGSGQLRPEMERLAREWKLNNITFQNWVPTQHLGEYIRSFDLSLGIFGSTAKAMRVIPSKIFDSCAVGVPFVSADTPALNEVFYHKKNAWLIPANNPEALATAIVTLKSNVNLRRRMAEAVHQAGKSRFSMEQIGIDLLKAIL
ncbi:MAG: glycosyltransferase [Desulfobacterales bacterium]|nr:MAG: glycosyltransferase [Desulfobacterales bacterium]